MDEKVFHVLERFKPFKVHRIGHGRHLPILNSHISTRTRKDSQETSAIYPSSVFSLQDLCRRYNITGQKWTGIPGRECLGGDVSTGLLDTATHELHLNTTYKRRRLLHKVSHHQQPPSVNCTMEEVYPFLHDCTVHGHGLVDLHATRKRLKARFKHEHVATVRASIISMFSEQALDALFPRENLNGENSRDNLNIENIQENLNREIYKIASQSLNKRCRELEEIADGSTGNRRIEREESDINDDTEKLDIDQKRLETVRKLHACSKTASRTAPLCLGVNAFGCISTTKHQNTGTVCVKHFLHRTAFELVYLHPHKSSTKEFSAIGFDTSGS